ncbi:hypothetical protein B0J18DRAFT_432077 [Chaetomium sp. MPI-SDFR-AT-0129]|nr:hypothetical protein B0J18DRAFT_432077 [Chaetomium sp. MPI-SDFR-AT-0129]
MTTSFLQSYNCRPAPLQFPHFVRFLFIPFIDLLPTTHRSIINTQTRSLSLSLLLPRGSSRRPKLGVSAHSTGTKMTSYMYNEPSTGPNPSSDHQQTLVENACYALLNLRRSTEPAQTYDTSVFPHGGYYPEDPQRNQDQDGYHPLSVPQPESQRTADFLSDSYAHEDVPAAYDIPSPATTLTEPQHPSNTSQTDLHSSPTPSPSPSPTPSTSTSKTPHHNPHHHHHRRYYNPPKPKSSRSKLPRLRPRRPHPKRPHLKRSQTTPLINWPVTRQLALDLLVARAEARAEAGTEAKAETKAEAEARRRQMLAAGVEIAAAAAAMRARKRREIEDKWGDKRKGGREGGGGLPELRPGRGWPWTWE